MNAEKYTQLGLRGFPRALARAAKKSAALKEMTLAEFVALAVAQALDSAKGSSLDLSLERDLAWYERHRVDLLKRYPKGTSLAIVGERVVDSDVDSMKLAARIRKAFGRRSIVMPRVGQAIPLTHVRSPHRVR
jgi:hypothetical protein